MIIVDTNVLSEVLRPAPSGNVRAWMEANAGSNLFTTTITLAEVHFGLELLPPGKRRSELEAAIARLFSEFAWRILPFDERAAREFALICARRRRSGRPMTEFDGQIAAIARSLGATIATRNINDFQDCGIELIDPWSA